MKKIIFLAILLIITTQAYPTSFTVFGKVYNEDGSKGTSLTANSYCGLKTYRQSIPGEIGMQNIGPDSNCYQKIFPAYYMNVDTPAYFNSDVGSYDWGTPVEIGQHVITVVEVYENQFPLCMWNGASYVGARIKILSQEEIDNGGVDMPDTRLESVPAPQPQTILSDSVTLTWTGLSYDPDNLVTGYTVYRSTEPGGLGGYVQLTATASQVKGSTIYYTDTGLNQSDTYYYKIAVNIEWGGGNGAPDYFVSNAVSPVSPGILLGGTPSITPAITETPYYTWTQTWTETPTSTFTITETSTATETDTPTLTLTLTWTLTMTPSSTITEITTSIITFTNTPSLTPTTTYIQQQISDSLKSKVMRDKIIVLNNPIKDGNLRIALYNENNGIVWIFLYNICGELVMKISSDIASGFSILRENISKASGIYILRVMIKTDTKTINLPVKKVIVIR